MSKWDGFPMLGFDTESTGVDVTQDRIVTACIVRIDPGHRPHISRYIVDPGIDIPTEAEAIHGYSRARAAAEATHTVEQMLFEITGRLAYSLGHGIPVVAFNAAYDFSLLEHENHRHRLDGLVSRLGPGGVQPVIDPFVLDRFADPYRKGGRKLADVCRTYGVTHTGEHQAEGDALAACRLFPRVMAKHARKFPGMTLPGLHQSQVGWRKTQMDSLREWFDRKGTPHDGCDGGWPLMASAKALPKAVTA